MTDAFPPRFFSGIIGISSGAIAITAASHGDLSVAAVLGLVSVATGGIAIGSFYVDGRNVGRGRTRTSRFTRRFASLVWLQVRGCGCVYPGGYDHRTPGREWVESESVWIRETHGGRVKFRKAKTGLRRCHRCGKHYSDTEKERSVPFGREGVSRECWPEDEPDVRAELDARVVDEGVADD